MKELIIRHLPAADGQPARVRVGYRTELGAQAQERETPFDFTVSDDDRSLLRWYLEEYLVFPWGEFRARAGKAEEAMRRLGKALFDAVFADRNTGALYAHVADHLPETRVVIQADDPAGIALPWELLRDPARGDYGELARRAAAFVRGQADLILEPSPAPTGETFNILLVICRPEGPEDVPFQSVARPLLELVRPYRDHIRVDVLRPPTLEQLERTLNDKPNFYHVLHFDGHGVFPRHGKGGQFYGQGGVPGHLIFEAEGGGANPVSGTQLGALLADKGVPIVLLNACQSGMTQPESPYPSVGNQLLRAGVRGVVAMAFSVYVQTAVRFMARLYGELVNGVELARAVTLAREELCVHPRRSSPIGDIPLQDWIVPVLFHAAPVSAPARGDGIHLELENLRDQQARAGAEIGCPEPPAFGFVGRDGVMLELERAFQHESIVLLRGMAGVGKTEMAAGFARWWAETGALDGPIFFFRFEHYQPLARVLDSVGQAFNPVIKQQLKQEWHLLDLGQRREVVLQILKQIPCLLIWDNFEPVAGFPTGTPSAWTAEEQAELRDFLRGLRGGKTKVLLTSRRDEPWLAPIYRRVEIGGLTLLEAQELALRVLRRAGLDERKLQALPDYTRLLQYLRGNPLAIQVILPELGRMVPEALLRALQTGEATLGSDDPTQGRERSLAASLTYSLDALDPTLRQRLGILAFFQGFVDADVLAIISKSEDAPELLRGLDRDAWIALLDAAAEVGLLQKAGEGYYHVHPALPWFFHDLLAETFPGGDDWLARAFATAYATYGRFLIKFFQSNAKLAMTLLAAEEANLLYALSIARQHEQWAEVGGILYGLNRLLTTQGRWVEWKRLVTSCEADAADKQGEPLPGYEGLWRALLGHLAEIAVLEKEWEKAESTYYRLMAHFEQAGDERNMAAVLHQLGRIAEERRQFDQAEQCYRQSLTIKERIGDEYGQAITLHQLGRIDEERRRFDAAERWYRQSLAIEERIGDENGQASTLQQLGRITEERRQFNDAERLYRQSLALEERIGDEYGQAGTLHNLGNIALRKRQFEEAECLYRQSLALRERIGDENGQAGTLNNLGTIAQEKRQFDEAERWYRQSLVIKERIGDEYGQFQSFGKLGDNALRRQQFNEAESWYRQGLAIIVRIGDEYGQAGILHQLGMIAEFRGHFGEAITFYSQAEALFARFDDPHNLGIVQESLARMRGKPESEKEGDT